MPPAFRRLIATDRFADCARVLLAFIGLLGFTWHTGHASWTVPLLLGTIACALAETDDSWRGRVWSAMVVLPCFAVASLAVQQLLGYPWLFAPALPLATFALVMLGAASTRFATIANATLILSVYTMIAADQPAPAAASWWREPLLLTCGAAWYAALSLAWSVAFTQQPVRRALAQVFAALADFIDAKSRLFEPVHGRDEQQLRVTLAMRNERVVDALNAARLVLVERIGRRPPQGILRANLRLYFATQDIHERASSSHYPYQALTAAFFHSDVLFRCERLLKLEAARCREHARHLRLHGTMAADAPELTELGDLTDAIAALRLQRERPRHELFAALDALVRNIRLLDGQLKGAIGSTVSDADDTLQLQNPDASTLRDGWQRIRLQLTTSSSRCRHALRLAVALVAGYGLLHAIHPRHGYWILLTTLFVCQPTYGASKKRLYQRTGGTMLGLFAGWLTLRLGTPLDAQLVLVAVSGVAFFAWRRQHYLQATAAITWFVVLCFNQVGAGYDVMLPRLLDTIIGAVIGALSVYLILPDWQDRRLQAVLATTLRRHASYLQAAVAQYGEGRQDNLPYRIARRDAQNADAALSATLANMLREPGHRRHEADTAMRFLSQTHTLLGHVSALGAHRQTIGAHGNDALLVHTRVMIEEALRAIADDIDGQGAPPDFDLAAEALAIADLDTAAESADEAEQPLYGQLAQLLRQLPPIRETGAILRTRPAST
jgi:YccS/YhfK family integral membrane protein